MVSCGMLSALSHSSPVTGILAVLASGSSFAAGSHGACRSAPSGMTCGPSSRCTAASRRASSTGSWRSGFHASRPRTITLIDGSSTVAPTPAVVMRWRGHACPIRVGAPQCPVPELQRDRMRHLPEWPCAIPRSRTLVAPGGRVHDAAVVAVELQQDLRLDLSHGHRRGPQVPRSFVGLAEQPVDVGLLLVPEASGLHGLPPQIPAVKPVLQFGLDGCGAFGLVGDDLGPRGDRV